VRLPHRVLVLAALFLVEALALTGCIHTERAISLNGDGSGSYRLTIGVTQQLMNVSNAQITGEMDDFGAKVKQVGGSFRRYDDSGYSYWEYTRPFGTIAQLNQFLGELPQASSSAGTPPASATTSDTFQVTQDANLLTNSFHVTGKMSLAATSPGTTNPQLEALLKDMRETFAVTMPGWVSSHVGGSQSDNTVSYTIHYGEQATIDVSGGGYNTRVLYLVGGGLALLLLGAGAADSSCGSGDGRRAPWRRSARRGVEACRLR
jgi:hypothetical protein